MTRTSLFESCPYCGEPVELLLEASDLGQEYIEDCEVCCQPMLVTVFAGEDGQPVVTLSRDSD